MDLMQEAIKQAQKAFAKNEVPVGAVVVRDGVIIARGYNQRETKQNALMHAEIVAINSACKKLKSWRLDDCELFVTLEPCSMCAGAILNSRFKKIYIGALDPNYGAVVSKYQLLNGSNLNHNCEYEILKSQKCEEIIKQFFKNIRKK